MPIIPVIDLKGGQVVRAVAGHREEYRPIVSQICPTAEPAEVAKALVDEFGFETVYVADLGAIDGTEPCWLDYERIARAGLKLWIDAGLGVVAQARMLAERRLVEQQTVPGRPIAEKIVVGLETLPSPTVLANMVQQIGTDRFILSLDLQDGLPRTPSADWSDLAIEDIFDHALHLGMEQFIVLDLARVGSGTGIGTEAICSRLRGRAPQAYIAAGGGLRDTTDVGTVLAAGCDAVLVASALHDGRITPGDVAFLNAFRT